MCPGRQGKEENAGNGGRDYKLDNVGVWGANHKSLVIHVEKTGFILRTPDRPQAT